MFLDDLQQLLRGLTTPVTRPVSPADLRQELHRLLKQGAAANAQRAYSLWSDRLEVLGDFLSSVPVGTWPLLDRDPHSAVSLLLETVFGIEHPTVELVDKLEAARLMEQFATGEQDCVRYALEAGLLARHPRTELTALGRALLRLTGRDAIRFLLTVETEASMGPWDDWRISADVLSGLIEGVGERYEPNLDEWYLPCSDKSVKRLVRLQVLSSSTASDQEARYFRVVPSLRDLVREVLAGGPWRTAVRTMGAEHARVVFDADEQASRATSELSRLVTHEVRNALVPVRRHAEQLARHDNAEVAQRAEKIVGGVKRVLGFVDQLVTITELVSSNRMPTRLSTLLDDSTVDLEGHERVVRELSDVTLELAREPLARALRNVIQNALQISSGRVIVRGRKDSSTLLLEVEDEGPGVPERDRERVFEDGFTTREGGTGFGLAMTRRIVTELGGTVTCEPGRVLSGARFVLTLRLTDTP